MAAEEGVLAEFLDLLTPENRQWFESRPEAEQREVATRHLEAVQGDKEHALGAYDTHDTDVSGVAVGDLQDPAQRTWVGGRLPPPAVRRRTAGGGGP
ncbi:hypothetical protein [Streptomyces capuensis]|uniref:hypothetical protein n=1 Tax=Streptomyces capuensis TaxID=1464056 RepID=UPI0004C17D33|nr:hypothetical protein [Streptomyces capuensis]